MKNKNNAKNISDPVPIAPNGRVVDLADVVREQENTIAELQKKFDEQLDGTSALVKDCRLWRDKYQKLVKDFRKLEKNRNALQAKNDDNANIIKKQHERNNDILYENGLLKKELSDRCEANGTLKKDYDDIVSKYENAKVMAADAEKARKDEYDLRLQYQQKCDSLENNVKWLDDELKRTKLMHEEALSDYDREHAEVLRLKNRTLWERIMNR